MTHSSTSSPLSGVIYAAGAFLFWGLSPVFWKSLRHIPALEITMHRLVWSCVMLIPLIILMGQGHELKAALKNKRTVMVLLFTGTTMAANWWLYVWAVNNDLMLQASLGYYFNPIMNVLLGMVFLRERLRIPQLLAVLLAAGGVANLTVYYGEFPWIAVVLTLSFGFYGLIRKVTPVGSIVGLTIETLWLAFPAAIYLFYLDGQGVGSVFRVSLKMDLLLMCASPMTAIPLLLFTLAARRINLSTLGLMQYIGPSGIFLLAVFAYHEPFSLAQVWTFVMIWAALTIFSIDSIRYYRRHGVDR